MKKKKITAGRAQARGKMTRKTAVILASVSALLVTGIVALVLALVLGGRAYDYTKKDLTKYLNLKKSDYIGIKVELLSDYSVTDDLIEKKLIALRIANRKNEHNTENTFLDWGYDVHIRYWGSYTDDYGNEIQFAGGSNMAASSPSELTLGSGSFIDGFEAGLVGKGILGTYRDYNTVKGLEISTNDIVYLAVDHYRYTNSEGEDETGSFSNLRLDLSDPGILGAAFAEQIAKLKTGDSFDFGYSSSRKTEPLAIDVNRDGVAEQLVLSGSVLALAEDERETASVEAIFPEDYHEESLRGKTATFRVFVESADEYDVPTEAELTKKMVQTVYRNFESDATGGEFLAALREYLYTVVTDEKAEERRAYIENQIWTHLMEHVSFTGKYPRKALKENREEAEAQLRSEYAQYAQQYQITFEEYAKVYYEVGSNETWRDGLERQAKKITREEILVYSIVKAEKWFLTDAEFEAGKEKILKEYAEKYDMDKDEVYKRIGKSAIYENILFEKILTKLTENAVVTDKQS